MTGIDLSPRLIAMAQEQDPDGRIDYRAGDLSERHSNLNGAFDLVGSYLVLNDVEHYLAALLDAGLTLKKLVDVLDAARADWGTLPPGSRFPRFMILAFTRP